MVRQWIVRVMGPDAEDLRAFLGLFLLLPIYVRLGLEPSVSNLDILILAEHYPFPRSCINFCLGCEGNRVMGGLQGWCGCTGCVGQLGTGLPPFWSGMSCSLGSGTFLHLDS